MAELRGIFTQAERFGRSVHLQARERPHHLEREGVDHHRETQQGATAPPHEVAQPDQDLRRHRPAPALRLREKGQVGQRLQHVREYLFIRM